MRSLEDKSLSVSYLWNQINSPIEENLLRMEYPSQNQDPSDQWPIIYRSKNLTPLKNRIC